MANPEHLKILKQGADVWNQWRRDNPSIRPDLSGAILRRVNLTGANLNQTDLSDTTLEQANLAFANLYETNLNRASLPYANLTAAQFVNADLSSASLEVAIFAYTNLDQTNLTQASLHHTVFARVDLSTVVGLEKTKHLGPSTIGIDTLYLSQGKIPEVFLRGCGVPEDFITYARSLVINPIDYYSCFISYSSKDSAFADRLHADLQAKAIRCWYAPEDLRIGEKFRTTIEESIRIYDKVMVVLSENSIQSAWVEEEAEAALERERQHPGSLVLFPIRLDDAVMETKQAWAASLRRIRHIGDFSKWKNHDSYQKAFDRLLRDLKSQTKTAAVK